MTPSVARTWPVRGIEELLSHLIRDTADFSDLDDHLIHLYLLRNRLDSLDNESLAGFLSNDQLTGDSERLLRSCGEFLDSCYVDDANFSFFKQFRKNVLEGVGTGSEPGIDWMVPDELKAPEQVEESVAMDAATVGHGVLATVLPVSEEELPPSIAPHASPEAQAAQIELRREILQERLQTTIPPIGSLEKKVREENQALLQSREKAQEEASRSNETAQEEVRRLHQEAEEEASRLHKEALEEVRGLHQEAEEKVSRLHKKAEEEASRLHKEALEEVRRIQEIAREEARLLREESQRLEEEARVNAAELLEKSQDEARKVAAQEAERMLAEAKAAALKIQEEAKTQAGSLIENLRQEILENARLEAKRIIAEARTETGKVREKALQLVKGEAQSAAGMPVSSAKENAVLAQQKSVIASETGILVEVLDLFRVYAKINTFVSSLSHKRPEYQQIVRRLGASLSISEFIASRDEADRVLAFNLTSDVLQVVRVMAKDPELPEKIHSIIREAIRVCKAVEEKFKLGALPREPEKRRFNIRGRMLLMFAEYLRPRTALSIFRSKEEHVPGIVPDNIMSLMADAVGKITPPEKTRELDQMTGEISMVFRLSRQTQIDWDALFSSDLCKNFLEFQRNMLIENKQLRESVVRYIVRKNHETCREKKNFFEATRCGSHAACDKDATLRNGCIVERETKQLLETLFMPQADWDKLATVVHGITMFCLQPEYLSQLDSSEGGLRRSPAFLMRNPIRYLAVNGIDKGWDSLLKKSLSADDVAGINKLLGELPPRLRETCFLQLMHREVLGVELTEQILMKRFANRHRDRILHEMPAVAEELTNRFRWFVARSFFVEKGVVANRPEINFKMEILRLKNLLVKLGFNQPAEGEKEGALDKILTAPSLLEQFHPIVQRVQEEAALAMEYATIKPRGDSPVWEKDNSASEMYRTLVQIGFDKEARLVAQLTQNAA